MTHEIIEDIRNILIAFSMLVGMVAVSIIESIWNPPKEWVVIDINSFIAVINTGIDVALYGTSLITTHPLTVVMFVAFMAWFVGKMR